MQPKLDPLHHLGWSCEDPQVARTDATPETFPPDQPGHDPPEEDTPQHMDIDRRTADLSPVREPMPTDTQETPEKAPEEAPEQSFRLRAASAT